MEGRDLDQRAKDARKAAREAQGILARLDAGQRSVFRWILGAAVAAAIGLAALIGLGVHWL